MGSSEVFSRDLNLLQIRLRTHSNFFETISSPSGTYDFNRVQHYIGNENKFRDGGVENERNKWVAG